MAISNGSLSAVVDGTKVVEVPGSCLSRGLAGLGCGKYHYCGFRDFSASGSGATARELRLL
jgi:hypothetical protein